VAEQRKAERDALTATHDAKMKALRDGISASKRARTATPSLPFLEASKAARMDKGVARAPAPPLRPAGSEPAASPREVERPLGPVGSGEPPRSGETLRHNLFVFCVVGLNSTWVPVFSVMYNCLNVCFARLLLKHCACLHTLEFATVCVGRSLLAWCKDDHYHTSWFLKRWCFK
jgi:hypothetical protein